MASLVDAGEEVSKAVLYNMAYEDVITFDYKRAGERPFLLGEDRLLGEHENKQASLYGLTIGVSLVQLALKFQDAPEADREEIAKDPEPWVRKEMPEVETFLELAPRLEELRQSRYSGSPKPGKRGRRVSIAEFRRLRTCVEVMIDFSEWELTKFRWGRGELSSLQSELPAFVGKLNPKLEAARGVVGRRKRGEISERAARKALDRIWGGASSAG